MASEIMHKAIKGTEGKGIKKLTSIQMLQR